MNNHEEHEGHKEYKGHKEHKGHKGHKEHEAHEWHSEQTEHQGPWSVSLVSALLSLGVALAGVRLTTVHAQVTPASVAPANDVINLTASSANVTGAGVPVKIRILRRSTDEERTPIVAALTPGVADGAALNPTAALTAAIGRAPTLGYVWTNEVTGHAIKYAYHAGLPDGGERIILATDRRLGAYTSAGRPTTAASATDYEFTLIEIRLDARGAGSVIFVSFVLFVVRDFFSHAEGLHHYYFVSFMTSNDFFRLDACTVFRVRLITSDLLLPGRR